jgi:mono/diheme cytochrome c family protein
MRPWLLTVAALVAAASSAFAQTAPSFTAAQAEHGADLYRQNCASCHGDHLNDGQFGPSLKGGNFKTNWGGKPVGALFDLVTTTMPPGSAGVMGPEEYADIVALMLQTNGVAAGATPLPADSKALAGLTIP